MTACLFPSCVGLRSALHALGCLPRLVGQNLPSLPDIKIRAFIVCVTLVFCAVPAHAETTIPRAAQQYRAQLIREARAVWGLSAPVSVFAAQIHTESWWRNDTVSSVGAQGLAQFMPVSYTHLTLPTIA